MQEAPSLFSLCMKTITMTILHGRFFSWYLFLVLIRIIIILNFHVYKQCFPSDFTSEVISCFAGCHHVQDIYELPSDLFDSLIVNLPPLALQNIHELLVTLTVLMKMDNCFLVSCSCYLLRLIYSS